MGYGSDIDMSQSNAALQKSFASNPVTVAAGYTPPPEYAGSGDEFQQFRPSNAVSVHHSATALRQGDSATMPGSAGPTNEMDAYAPDKNAEIGPTTSYKAPGVITAAVNQGLPGGSGAPLGMTTEQSNAYYGPINAAMTAKTEQDQQQNRAVSDMQSNASVAIERSRLADLRAQRTPGAAGYGSQAAAEKAAGVAAAANTALSGARTGRDYTKEAQGSQDLVQKAREAQLGEAGKSQSLVSGGQGIEKGAQELQSGKYQLMQQQHLSDLQARAAAPGPDGDAARDALAIYQKAMSGKGGPITAEDKLKVYGDFLQATARMMGGDALSHVPNFSDWSDMISGKGAQPPADWMTRAKAANPGATPEALAKLYASKKPA